MTTERHNLQTIAEVLIDELGKLDKTSKRIEAVLPAVDQRLEQLSNTQLSVDTKPTKAILDRIEYLSKTRSFVPTWVYVVTLILICLLLGTSYGFYDFYQKAERSRRDAENFELFIRETDQVDRYNQWAEK